MTHQTAYTMDLPFDTKWKNELAKTYFLVRNMRPHLITDSSLVAKAINQKAVVRQNSASDGDRLYTEFIADGTETTLGIGYVKGTSSGIIDVYINGVLDTSGIDLYAGSTADGDSLITVTQPIKPGYNLIEYRVNGKNASSSGYLVSIYSSNIR